MRELRDLTSEAHQEHLIVLNDDEVTLEMRFLSVTQIWVINVFYKNRSIIGVKLSLGVLHIFAKNLPFDFIVTDNSGLGVDPYAIDDFVSGRCSLFILDPSDMEAIRGVPVEFS